jgi:hypothetical protein
MSSRCNHIKKYHSEPVNSGKHNKVNISQQKINCKYCNKEFNKKQSKSRHELNYCKERIKKLDIKNETNQFVKKDELKDFIIEEAKNLVDKLMKSLKIHPKTLNKINNQLNNINNGTINNTNNTINIVQLGRENLSDILSNKEKINILNRQAMSINDLVELVHTSDKYIQFKNVYITNLQSNIGYKYEEKSNKFIATNKNELLNEILDSRIYDIQNFYSDVQHKMDPKRAERIKTFIDKINEEPEMKHLKKEEIRLILYNNKETIMKISDSLLNNNESLTNNKIDNDFITTNNKEIII